MGLLSFTSALERRSEYYDSPKMRLYVAQYLRQVGFGGNIYVHAFGLHLPLEIFVHLGLPITSPTPASLDVGKSIRPFADYNR